MSHIKILCLLTTFMVFYFMYHTCITNDTIDPSDSIDTLSSCDSCSKDDSVEGLANTGLANNNIINTCKDNPNWYVEGNSGKKHMCSDIGKTISCYSMNINGVEGWQQCLETCGNCANTQVSQLPMNILAGFSGDPVEDFGVVLHTDTDRQWVGKQDGGDGGDVGDDVRGYVDEDKSEDIEDIYARLDSIQQIFDLITGNVKQCNIKKDSCKKDNEFAGCNGQCINCPTRGIPTPTPHSYIKQNCEGVDNNENCTIQFPAVDLTCANVANIPTPRNPLHLLSNPAPTHNKCQDYFLFDKIIDDDDDDDPVGKKAKKDKNKLTLYDMCPKECGVNC